MKLFDTSEKSRQKESELMKSNQPRNKLQNKQFLLKTQLGFLRLQVLVEELLGKTLWIMKQMQG